MNKKRLHLLVLVLSLIVIVSATLVACDNGGTGNTKISVTYMVDGEIAKTGELDGFSAINGFYKPTKTGYSFVGWYVDAELTVKLSGDTPLVDGLVLYAKFTKKSFRVEFIGEDGAIIDEQDVLYLEGATAPTPPEIAGKTFTGWDKDFSSITENTTVIATYEDNTATKYTVTFKSGEAVVYSGQYTPGDQTAMFANTATDALSEPAGFLFVGWVDGEGNEIGNNFPSEGSDLTYFASYALRQIVGLNLTASFVGTAFDYAPDKTVTLTASHTVNDGITYVYAWYKGNELLSAETKESLDITGATVGTYTYKVVVTASKEGMTSVSSEKTFIFTVTNGTLPQVTAEPTSVEYDGQAHNITVNSLPGDLVEYRLADEQWAESLNLVNAGVYEVYYRVTRANFVPYESTTPVTVTISKRVVNATIDPTSLTYGDPLPTSYTLKYSGFLGVDDESVFTGSPVFTPSIANSLAIGTFGVSATTNQVVADNYTLLVADGEITIGKKTIEVTADNATVSYGNSLPTLTVSYSGFVTGESSANLTIAPTATCTEYVQGTTSVGTYVITVSGGSSNNYNFVYNNGELTVSPREATITADPATVTYGDELDLSAHTYKAKGVLVGDSITVSYTAETYDTTQGVGSKHEITPFAEHDNYTFTFVNGAITINPKSATITAGDTTVTYGTEADFSAMGFEPAGLINGDTVSVKYSAPEYTLGADAGETFAIIPSAEHDNYTFTYVNGTLTVVKKAVALTADNKSVVYGEALPALTATAEGLFGEDVLDYTLSAPDYKVGTTKVGEVGIIVTLGTNDNYDVTATNGTLSVTKKSVTVTVDNKSKTYGDATPAFTGTVNGLVGEDVVEITYTLDGDGINAGQYTINATLKNEEANYTLGEVTTGTLAVGKKSATLSADNKSVVYGNNAPDFTATANGLVGEDTLNYTISADYVAGTNKVGDNVAITITLGENPNYEVAVTNGALTITAKAVTVTVDSKTITYGDATPAFTGTVNGLVGVDVIELSFGISKGDGVSAGTHTITAQFKNEETNYTLSGVEDGTLTINKKSATLKAQDETITYGDEKPAFTAVPGGLVGEDSLDYDFSVDYIAGVTGVGTVAIEIVLGNNPNYDVTTTNGTLSIGQKAISYTISSETAKAWSNSVWTNNELATGHVASGTLTFTATEIGTYTYPNGFEWTTAFDVKSGDTSVLANYNVTFNVTIDLIERDFEYVAEDKHVTYDGNAHSIEVVQVTLDPLAPSQNYTVEYKVGEGAYSTTVPTFTNAGTYAVSYRITPEATDYYPNAEEGTFTLYVDQKDITLTVDDKTMTYGDAFPTLTATANGLVGEDSVELDTYIADGTVKNVGEYTITSRLKDANGNYKVTGVTTGTLTVDKKSATLTADNKSVVYGNNAPEFTATANGLVGEDTLNYTLSADYTAGTNKVGDNVAITITLGENPNYEVAVTNGALTITAKAVTVTVDSKTITYGDATPAFTGTVNGLVGDDVVELSFGISKGDGVSAGTHTITTQFKNEETNYTLSGVEDGTLTINKKSATLKAQDETITYGDEKPAFTAVPGGLVGEDTLNYTVDADYVMGITGTGKVAIVITLGENPNYDVTATNGELTVAKKALSVTVDNKTATYGDALPTYTGTVNGLVGQDSVEIAYAIVGGVTPKNADTYSITATLKNAEANYSLSATAVTEGTLTITAKAVTIKAADGTVEYYRDANFTDHGCTIDGLADGDKIAVSYTTNYVSGASVGGTYNIVPKEVGTYTNYTFSYENGSLTVIPRTVTITADDMTVTYGDSVPTFEGHTFTEAGLLDDGTVLTVTYTTNYVSGASVGTYKITPAVSGSYANYTFSCVDGVLTVSPKAVTAGWELADTYTYNGTDQIVAVKPYYTTIDGGKAYGKAIVVSSLNHNYSSFVGADTYTVSAESTDANYVLTGTTTVTINKANYTDITHPVVDGGVYNPATTLASLSLNNGYRWANSSIVPVVNNTGYTAIYNGDPNNYNDCELTVAVGLTKATATFGNLVQSLRYDSTAPYKFDTSQISVTRHGSTSTGSTFEGAPEYTVASTYQFAVSLVDDNYQGTATCTLKVVSVDVGGTLYTIEDALNTATSGNAIVNGSTSFSGLSSLYSGSGYYTVKSGVTLLLPYQSGDTSGYVGGGDSSSSNYSAHPDTAFTIARYSYLIIPAGVDVTVANGGTLTVGAMTGKKNSGTQQNNVSGGYGEIRLNGNMTVASATLNVYGYITGSGKITATGSTQVTENMYISGWMGGTISSARFMGTADGFSVSGVSFAISSGNYTVDNPTMFPFSQYELRSIQTTLELNYGTSLRGAIKIATSEQSISIYTIKAQINATYFPIISSSTTESTGVLRMSSTDAKVTKEFANNRVSFTTEGTIYDGYSVLSVPVLKKTVQVSSQKVLFPIDGRTDIIVKSGSFTQNYQYKLMPGATITVKADATYYANNTVVTYKDGFTDINTYSYPTGRGDAAFIIDGGKLKVTSAFGGTIVAKSNGTLEITSTNITNIKSLEGSGSMARSGLNMVFTFSESNSQTRNLELYNYSIGADNKASYLLANGTPGTQTYTCSNGTWT